MTRDKRIRKICEKIKENHNIMQALDRFVKRVNTPTKADEMYGYLMFRSDTRHDMASEFLRVVGEEMQMGYMHKSDYVTRELADLCLLLGSPDNCRIVSCAISDIFDILPIVLNKRDSSNAEWFWIMDARSIISALIHGIAFAKIHEEDGKAKEVAE